MREAVAEKGLRYLTEGRLTIISADARRIEALVKGDSGHQYTVIHDGSRWACSCPARGRCAHMTALMRVCSLPGSAVLG